MDNLLKFFNQKLNINYLILIIFLLGLYFYVRSNVFIENMENREKEYENKCGNILLEKDGKILLFNNNTEEKIKEFNNLDEYKDYLEFQKFKGIECPVLFLQYAKDTQNNDILQIKPSVFNNDGGLQPISSASENTMLDATRDSTPGNLQFNKGMYSGFDQYNQNIGLKTVLDYKFKEINEDGKSRNPYDTNWGGKTYTTKAIKKGDYKDREVYRYKNKLIDTQFDKIIKE